MLRREHLKYIAGRARYMMDHIRHMVLEHREHHEAFALCAIGCPY